MKNMSAHRLPAARMTSAQRWYLGTAKAPPVFLRVQNMPFLLTNELMTAKAIVRMLEPGLELECIARAERLGALQGMGLAERRSPE